MLSNGIFRVQYVTHGKKWWDIFIYKTCVNTCPHCAEYFLHSRHFAISHVHLFGSLKLLKNVGPFEGHLVLSWQKKIIIHSLFERKMTLSVFTLDVLSTRRTHVDKRFVFSIQTTGSVSDLSLTFMNFTPFEGCGKVCYLVNLCKRLVKWNFVMHSTCKYPWPIATGSLTHVAECMRTETELKRFQFFFFFTIFHGRGGLFCEGIYKSLV